MNQNTAEQVARRLPVGMAFSMSFYKREDHSNFTNGMGVIPAHHEEEALPNLVRLSKAIILEEVEEEYENCDGTIEHSIHPATNTAVLASIIDDELFYTYFYMRAFGNADKELFRSYLSDHTFIGPDEAISNVAVSIDDMTVGQWLRHSKNDPRAIYFSKLSDWVARVI